MNPIRPKRPFDLKEYVKYSTSGLCFICEFVKGGTDYDHHLVFENELFIAFLNRNPTLFGYTLVAPIKHLEQVTGDMSCNDYLELQRLIYCISEGMRALLHSERIYLLSLGSQQANSHIHWHVAPLPPGIPLEEQQYHALMHENGVIEVSDAEQKEFAHRLGTEVVKKYGNKST